MELYSVTVRVQAQESDFLGLEFGYLHFQTVRTWVTYLSSLSFSFFIHK